MQLQKSGFSFLPDPRKDSLRDISRPSDEFAKNDLYFPYNLELLSLKHFLAHSEEINAMLLQEKSPEKY